MKRRNIVLVGGAGGHGEQLQRIREYFQNDTITVIREPELQWNYAEDKLINISRLVDYHKPSKAISAVNFLKALYKSFFALSFRKIDLIVSTGPAMAVPVCTVAKLLGIKTVHVESWSRINSVSNSTKLILKYNLANVIAYQYVDHVLAGEPNCEYWGHL